MNIQKKTRVSLKTVGRRGIPKGWQENRPWGGCHAPVAYRRARVRTARRRENNNLRNHLANNALDTYELLYIAQRDVDYLWFYGQPLEAKSAFERILFLINPIFYPTNL